MIYFLLLVAVIITICVILNNATSRIGVPVLLAFIMLGMLFGNNSFIQLDNWDLGFVEQVCTTALIFIMFYGGFGTRWKSAKPVATESVLLATVGVILTAGLTGLFCHFILGWKWAEAFLMGSVISSTDAASVFSILKSKKLGLKNGSAPLLEMESGSNDPCSYMLTILMLSILEGTASGGKIVWMLFAQLGFGAIAGCVIAQAASWCMKHLRFSTAGFDSLFLVAVALFSYALPSGIGGNGYLSAYIVGIVLGNQDFHGKKEMVHFFDGITSLMQVVIFFMLGLLAHPVNLVKCFLPALALFFILMFIARPLTLAIVLTPFRKYGFKQQCLLSFCGLRGASSIVFAIMATVGTQVFENDIFNVVFSVVLMSIALQGTLIPYVAKKLGQIDRNADVMKTFSDFSNEVDLQFTKMVMRENGPWVGKQVKEIGIPKDLLLCTVEKTDGRKLIPRGDTLIEQGDMIIMCSKSFEHSGSLRVLEHTVSDNSKWDGHRLKEYPSGGSQVMLIMRDGESIIPHGNTILHSGDKLYINNETIK